jgi:hypothetical protein
MPNFVRWYRVLVPTAPPPMITASAVVLMICSVVSFTAEIAEVAEMRKNSPDLCVLCG